MGEEGRAGRDVHQCERNIDWLPPARTRMESETWICALTRNRIGDLLVHGMMLNQLSQASQGYSSFFFFLEQIIIDIHRKCVANTRTF